MKCILSSAVLIALSILINIDNVYSQVYLAKGIFPEGFNIQSSDAISEISKFVDSNLKKSLELAIEYNEIAYISQYKEVQGRDSMEIIQIKLIPERTNIWRGSIYFIKNLRKRAMIYCNADTLFSISINGKLNYIFLSNYRVTFYTDIYCFDKSYKNPETIFWKNTDANYAKGKWTEEEYLVSGSVLVTKLRSELFVEFKVKNERTKKIRSQRKKINLD